MIYFDNAATTQVCDEVKEVIKNKIDEYGNPSTVYKLGREAKSNIETAREEIATTINAQPKEIYFTSGGTESDNWAIIGVAEAYKDKGRHIITSQVEHHAVLHTCEYLEKNGYQVTYLPVDKYGKVNPEDVKKAIRPDTILISIMFANNEIGTVNDIAKIGEIAKANKVLFHTDAVQVYGHIPIDVNALNIDLLSLSGHKIHAIKGIGALYVKLGVKIKAFVHGGAQERNRRGGTENTLGIMALGEASRVARINMEEDSAKIQQLRDYAIEQILTIPHTFLNGHPTDRLPGNVNISFEFIEGESLLLFLDMKGICASSGSACTSGSLDPSHVLLATGLKHEEAHGSLRISIGRYNTKEEVDTLVTELRPIVDRLRAMSPLYEDYINRQK